MKTLILSATREKDIQKTLLYQSLLPLKGKADFDFWFHTDNKDGLSKVYNRAFTFNKYKDYDAFVFVHDDVYLDDAFFVDKLEDGFAQFDIIGVAGGLNPVIKAPTLWHIMCGPGMLRGAAGHFDSTRERLHMTSFGHMPSRVTIMDGVFMAVNREKAIKANWRFNENYDFHLYDIASCLDANKKQLRCGVLPIHIVHQSPGLLSVNDPAFIKNQAQFLKEYGTKA